MQSCTIIGPLQPGCLLIDGVPDRSVYAEPVYERDAVGNLYPGPMIWRETDGTVIAGDLPGNYVLQLGRCPILRQRVIGGVNLIGPLTHGLPAGLKSWNVRVLCAGTPVCPDPVAPDTNSVVAITGSNYGPLYLYSGDVAEQSVDDNSTDTLEPVFLQIPAGVEVQLQWQFG